MRVREALCQKKAESFPILLYIESYKKAKCLDKSFFGVYNIMYTKIQKHNTTFFDKERILL